jgi:hypothetical protein
LRFGNDFPGALVETGQFEGDALVYRSEFPVEGAMLKLRNVTRLTDTGTLVSEEFMAMKDAPETLPFGGLLSTERMRLNNQSSINQSSCNFEM